MKADPRKKKKKKLQKFWTYGKTNTKIYLTHVKIMTQVKKYFAPRNPLNPCKNLTHTIHAPT